MDIDGYWYFLLSVEWADILPPHLSSNDTKFLGNDVWGGRYILGD